MSGRLTINTLYLCVVAALSTACPVSAGWLTGRFHQCALNLGLASDHFQTKDGWFTPQFKTKGDAERWLYSMIPRGLSASESDLLNSWPRGGHSITANRILRGKVTQVNEMDSIIIQPNFQLRDIVDTFKAIFAKSFSTQMITAYRAVGRSELGSEPELGDVSTDAGLMNVSLDQSTVDIHGRHRGAREGGQIQFIFSIPKNYPMTPTFAHDSYVDSTGRLNTVSSELELVLPQMTTFRVVEKPMHRQGILVVKALILLQSL